MMTWKKWELKKKFIWTSVLECGVSIQPLPEQSPVLKQSTIFHGQQRLEEEDKRGDRDWKVEHRGRRHAVVDRKNSLRFEGDTGTMMRSMDWRNKRKYIGG